VEKPWAADDPNNRSPDLEKQRLEVGWLIGNLWMVEGNRI
jgi:hypothetical protein